MAVEMTQMTFAQKDAIEKFRAKFKTGKPVSVNSANEDPDDGKKPLTDAQIAHLRRIGRDLEWQLNFCSR